jgi:hypothetical protein
MREILRRKEALASELEADWFLHLDPDEIPLGPRSGQGYSFLTQGDG